MSREQKKLAVLIDADNSQPKIIEGLLDEIANYGVASVKRIYGDWTDTKLKGWKNALLEHGIHPMQQFAYTTGKNATDSAMIIDAMDLLYAKNFDGFCIVSSDSDFTRLASRIRESGLTVYGFGEKKTPKSFMSACDKFIYTENLRSDEIEETDKAEKPKEPIKDISRDIRLLAILRNAVDDTSDYTGWSYLGSVGQKIVNKIPEFDSRNYGFKKLFDLMQSTNLFEFKEDSSFKTKAVYVRCKRSRNYV
ncbi:NYN domain-containing protein [Sulfurimonas sp. HSL-1716]|uniref:NYN domain-containing protein n=1 Tax=Hydrocurvibacter sulfurireducens TaxID=3131937 RepID=UPI0031F9787C